MDEIERFLRQVAARRQQAQQQQQAPAPPPPIQYVEPEIVEAATVEDRQSLAERHIDPSMELTRRDQRGEKTRLADDAMELHLHQKFDHDVGRLAGRSDRVATEYDDLGSEPYTRDPARSLSLAILDLFRSPASIRNAIILKEILDPPLHRW